MDLQGARQLAWNINYEREVIIRSLLQVGSYPPLIKSRKLKILCIKFKAF